MTKLLNAKEVGKILAVPEERVWQLTREKKIPFVLLGKNQYRYSEAKILEFIEQGGNREEASETCTQNIPGRRSRS